MKRSEIKVGDELYYDSSRDWALPKYGDSPGGGRAVVVDLGPFRINRDVWGYRAPEYTKDPKGSAVLVDLHRTGWSPTRGKAVPIAHLRGEWVETYAEVTAALAERQEARDEERRQQELAVDRAVQSMSRAGRLGFSVTVGKTDIRISVTEFERILDRLDGGS